MKTSAFLALLVFYNHSTYSNTTNDFLTPNFGIEEVWIGADQSKVLQFISEKCEYDLVKEIDIDSVHYFCYGIKSMGNTRLMVNFGMSSGKCVRIMKFIDAAFSQLYFDQLKSIESVKLKSGTWMNEKYLYVITETSDGTRVEILKHNLKSN
ncbi:hypothetical protein GYB22_09445 [bacterium]|nr:hypothetical protein [bacterium]